MSRISFSPSFESQFDPTKFVNGTFTRGEEFEQTVTVSIQQGETESFTFIAITDVTLLGEPDTVDVVVDDNQINFDGTYISGWEDLFTFVPPGESNKTTDPTTVVGTADLPDGQDLFDLDQDQKHFIFREYEVTVDYQDDMTSEIITETGILVHEVFNDLEAIRAFMANYDYGEG